MIEIRNLTVQFKDKKIFKNISYKFDQGRIYGIVGPNGIGKTTLLKCMLGLIVPDDGEVYINGSLINHYNRDEVVKNVSFLLSSGLIKNLSGWDNAVLFAKLYDVSDNYIVKLFKEFDIFEARNKKVKNYSLGMTQRLALVIALLNTKRKIIILDEPYMGLDPNGIFRLNQKLLKLKDEGYTILVSNHQLYESEKIFDEVIFLTKSGLLSSKDFESDLKCSLADKYQEIYNSGVDSYE